MKRSRSVIKDRTEIAKNIVEIVALCIAGGWALYTFGLKDKPSLEHRTKVDSELVWKQASGTGTCEAQLNVTFENIGTTAFDISRVRVRGWEFPAIALEGEEVARYIDVNSIQAKVSTFFDKTYDQSTLSEDAIWAPFLGHYPPGVVWKHSFQFVMKQIPDKWALLMVQLYEQGNESTPIDATYSWESVCQGVGDEKPNPNPKGR